MISIKKPNVNDAPWKILFSALFLSLIGLIALNSISYQSSSLALNPFYKQLLFLFLALIGFLLSFFTLLVIIEIKIILSMPKIISITVRVNKAIYVSS